MYSGEYFDKSSNTYYLRARYYNPVIGRFISEDTHWNPENSIYGDEPLVVNERQDPLGLNVYTYLPDMFAIHQSTNLYAYCGNNPLMFVDYSGKVFMFVTGAIGLVVGGIIGGVIAARNGENIWVGAGIGAAAGGLVGLTCGAAAGVVLAGSATATTAAVVSGATSIGYTIAGGSLYAGGQMIVNNIKKASSNITVLGRYTDGYLDLADDINARVFNVSEGTWNSMTTAEQWAMNERFLNESIEMGHDFILATNAYNTGANSFFEAEINYLLNNGYKIVDEGWRLIKDVAKTIIQ
ncbi:MAG TPA: RHS repeat-associated core domain-containing protein [Clostridia bacterium]|nr:RHS repeat-associated core domain-containing protein [Clostridia bacterium]